jgi:hypothetical protein
MAGAWEARGLAMRYMLLIYTKEESLDNLAPEERERDAATHRQVMDDAGKQGIFQGAAPLQPTRVATTVRMQDGKAMILDGPFAETKEQLAGYYILDCKDLDEAIAWATRIPTSCGGHEGCVEIRPFRYQPPSD